MNKTTFHGRTYSYNTPNHGARQIGVWRNALGSYIVGYDTGEGGMERINTPKLPVEKNPALLQSDLDEWAKEHDLKAWRSPAPASGSPLQVSGLIPQPSPASVPAKRGPGRPPRVLAILGKHSEKQIVGEIIRLHAITASSAAFVGYWLLLAKETVAYGDWQKWIEDNLPCSLRTAYGYMELATALMPKIPNGIGAEKLGELLESICAGKSAHQFLFQLKADKKPTDAGAPEADLSPEEQTKLEFEGAKKEAVWLGQQLNDWLHKTKGYMRLDEATRAGLADLFNEAHEVLKSTLE